MAAEHQEVTHGEIMAGVTALHAAVKGVHDRLDRMDKEHKETTRQVTRIHKRLEDGELRFNEQDKALLFQNSAIQAGQSLEHAATVLREGLEAVRKATLNRIKSPAHGTPAAGPDEDTNPGNPRPEAPTLPAPAPESERD